MFHLRQFSTGLRLSLRGELISLLFYLITNNNSVMLGLKLGVPSNYEDTLIGNQPEYHFPYLSSDTIAHKNFNSTK
jgi:hypothetical protein